MAYQDHQALAGKKPVACAVVTCSDSRKAEEDESGLLIRRLLEEAGHTHPVYRLVKDEPAVIRALIEELCERGEVQAIVLNGGTGVSRRDSTYDAVAGMLTKMLPGFGELFRMLSYEAIGSGAMLSRAVGGIVVKGDRHTVVFSIPGSPHAVELAVSKLIVPELSHLVWEVGR